jgi:hypothetical protein
VRGEQRRRRILHILHILGACLLVAGLVGPAAANAGPRAVHLVYIRGAGAERCPSQAELQQGVVARLGRDPFWGRGARPVWITISRSGTQLVATIAAQPENGGAAQVHAVTSRRGECTELASAVELALAIAIDPLAVEGRRSEAPPDVAEPSGPPTGPAAAPSGSVGPPPEAPEPSALVTAQPSATPDATSARDRHWFVGAELLLSVGTGPGAAPGFALALGARRGDWSLTLEARADYPTEVPVANGVGTVAAAPILAAAVPCRHLGWLAACAVATAGVLRGSARGGGLLDARSEVTPYCAAGARVAAELPFGARFALGAHFDLLATLTPTHLDIAQEEVWRTPVVSGTVGLSAIERFR